MNQAGPKLNEVLNLLAARAPENEEGSEFYRAWRFAISTLLEQPAVLDPRHKKSYAKLVGLPENNAHQYLGPNGRRNLRSRHLERLHKLLRTLGFGIDPLPHAPIHPAAADAWLNGVLKTLNDQPDDPPPASIADPDWRVVARPEAVEEVLKCLRSHHAVAITGMSGVGKSLLARQVVAKLQQSRSRVLELDARQWLEPVLSNAQSPTANDYVSFCGSLLSALAEALQELKPLNFPYQSFAKRLAILRQYAHAGSTNADPAFFAAFSDDSSWRTFVRAVAQHAGQLQTMGLLGAVAVTLSFGLRDVIVCIDDVWNFKMAQPVIEPLFAPRADGARLLVTSQEDATLGFLNEHTTIKIDDVGNRGFDPDFCYQVVAAWATPAAPLLTGSEAQERIAEFRRTHIAGNSAVRVNLEALIDKVGAHPLALAAVACAWRDEGKAYRAQFWKRACKAIENQPGRLLAFDSQQPRGTTLPPRFDDVLWALAFAWSLLDPATRERYLDLAIFPSDRPLDEELCHLLWERTERAGTRLPPALSGAMRPLRLFAAKSLTQLSSDRPGRKLHDLHRSMIVAELARRGERGLAERHRDFLNVAGLVDASGQFHLDEARHFRLMPHARTVFWPHVDDNDEEEEIIHRGRRVLDNLLHHVRGAFQDEPAERSVTQTLTSYRFLQACLDAPPQSGPEPTARSGNIDTLLAAFQGHLTKPQRSLLRTLRLASAMLARDRLQLAAQLIARTSADTWPEYARLHSGAKIWAPSGSFIPRYPFLAGGDGPLIASFPNQSRWIPPPHGRPTILSWSADAIELWDAATAQRLPLPLMRQRTNIEGAVPVHATTSSARAVSWSGNEICVWDLVKGEQIATLQINTAPALQDLQPHARRIAKLRVVPDAVGTFGVLYWTPNHVFLWRYPFASEPELILTVKSGIYDAQLVSSRFLLVQCFGDPWKEKSPLKETSLWDLVTGRILWSTRIEGATLTSNVPTAVLLWTRETISLRDVTTGNETVLLQCVDNEAAANHGAPSPHLFPIKNPLAGARLATTPEGERFLLFWTWQMIFRWNPARQELHIFQRPSRGRSDDHYQPAHDNPPLSLETANGLRIEGIVEAGVTALLWDALSREPRLTQASMAAAWLDEGKAFWIDDFLGAPAIMTHHRAKMISNQKVCLWDTSVLKAAEPSSQGFRGPAQAIQWVNYAGHQALFVHSHSSEASTQVELLHPDTGRPLLTQPIQLSQSGGEDLGSAAAHWIPSAPSSPKILTLSRGTISLWDPTTGVRSAKCYQDHATHDVQFVADAPGGPAILSRSYYSIELWDACTLTRRAAGPLRFEQNRIILGATWVCAPVPRIVGWTEGEVRLWDPLNQTSVSQFHAKVFPLCGVQFLPDTGKGCALLTWSSEQISLWDPNNGAMIAADIKPLQDESRSAMHYGWLVGAQWLSQTPSGGSILSWSNTRLRLWEPATGRLQAELPRWTTIRQHRSNSLLRPHSADDDALGVKWIGDTPDGPTILVWSNNEIRLWRPWSRHKLSAGMRHEGAVCGADLISDALGRPSLLSWSWDGSVRLWDLNTAEERTRIDFDAAPIDVTCAPARRGSCASPVFAVCCANGSIGVFQSQGSF